MKNERQISLMQLKNIFNFDNIEDFENFEDTVGVNEVQRIVERYLTPSIAEHLNNNQPELLCYILINYWECVDNKEYMSFFL